MSANKESVQPLRNIAVYVEEPTPGRFAWVLTESVDDLSVWWELQVGKEWLSSYQHAMAEGLLALQRMIEDLDVGPREKPLTDLKNRAGHVFGFGFGTSPTLRCRS